MQFELTKERIEQAFDLMGEYAAAQGIVIEIAVYGGSCLMLASDIRNASGDVDAVFLSNRSQIATLSDRVAAKLGMPKNWLNEGVRSLAPPIGNPHPTLLPYGDYPRTTSTGVGLRVHLPTPEYMLAMKILSNRLDDDTPKIQQDDRDAVSLMKITNITTKDALISLLRQCYPQLPGLIENDTLKPRINAKIETLIDAFTSNVDKPSPTWNAARGRPVRNDPWER